jgi:hypothetical protein
LKINNSRYCETQVVINEPLYQCSFGISGCSSPSADNDDLTGLYLRIRVQGCRTISKNFIKEKPGE